MITILNSSVLTEYGMYEYSKISLQDVIKLLNGEQFISAIGHASTAELLSNLTGLEITPNRIEYIQNVGDKALIFKIKRRLPEAWTIDAHSVPLNEYEFGLLDRIK